MSDTEGGGESGGASTEATCSIANGGEGGGGDVVERVAESQSPLLPLHINRVNASSRRSSDGGSRDQ